MDGNFRVSVLMRGIGLFATGSDREFVYMAEYPCVIIKWIDSVLEI